MSANMSSESLKKGETSFLVWLILGLVGLVVVLFILALASGKSSGLLGAIGNLFAPS